MAQQWTVDGSTCTVEHTAADGDRHRITIDGEALEVTVLRLTPQEVVYTLAGKTVRVALAREGDNWHVAVNGGTPLTVAPVQRDRRRHTATAAAGALNATMPGTVVQVLVAAGDDVIQGQPLIVLEAMKMESRIRAPFAGRVRALKVSAGEVVDRGQLLIDLTPADGD